MKDNQDRQPDIENKYRHPDDQPLRASVNEIQNFMEENPVWADMKEWIEGRKEMLEGALRQAQTIEDVRGIQKALDQLDDILELPEWFLIEQEEQQKNKN